jgi:hypothetical protein
MSKQVTAAVADGPPAAVRAAIKRDRVKEPSPDKLDELRKLVRNARVLKMEIERLEEDKAELERRYTKARTEVIPAFMEENNIPAITIGKEGNYPAYDCVVRPYYRANIAADWEPAKKEEAFKYLESIGEGDLIKTAVTFYFPQEHYAAVSLFLKAVGRLKFVVKVAEFVGRGKSKRKIVKKMTVKPPLAVVEKSVQWNTLSAWLRRRVERTGVVPKLDKIGGSVGVVADLKEVETQPKPEEQKS